MGERSGAGLVECAILEALDAVGARPGRRHRSNARVLAAVEDRIGLAPGYAYEVLLDLARPWTMPLNLVDGQGNYGGRGNDPAANPPYTVSRALAKWAGRSGSRTREPCAGPCRAHQRQRLPERDQAAVPPAGSHRGPPDDTAISLANRAAARDWAPRYPGLHRAARLPLSDLRDLSSSARDTDLLVCIPAPGTTAEQLRDQLMDVYGVYTTVPVALPRPLATMIRKWARAYGSEDLLTSLTAVENAIPIQPARG